MADEWIDRVFAVMALADQHTFQVLTKRPERMRAYLTALAQPHREREVKEAGRKAGALLGDMSELGWRITALPLRNVWLGTSVEDQPIADTRIPHLLATPAAVRFVSAEPLLGPVDLAAIRPEAGTPWDEESADLNEWGVLNASREGPWPRLDWVIVGGESGPGARPMHPAWARSLRDQCADAGVSFHFKQHGEWIGVPDLRNLPGGSGPGFGVYDHCTFDIEHEAVRIGKARAGRLLDGRTHDEFPGRAI